MSKITKLFHCCFAFTIITIFLHPILAQSQDQTSFDVLIKEGQKLARDYIIESAVMTVHLDNAKTASAQRTAEVQIVYTIFTLKNTTNFDEEFHSPITNAIVFRIRGSHPESDLIENTPDKKSWNIPLQLKPGQRETIVTAAKYFYPSGIPEKRGIHEFHDLKPSEDVFCYPNSDDVIGDLTLFIESPIPVNPPKLGDELLFDPNHPKNSHPESPALYPPDSPNSSPFILVAKWKNMLPGQVAELKISR